jgi:hypothetical protein
LVRNTNHKAPCYIVFPLLLRPKYSTLFSNILSLCSSHSVTGQVFHPYRTEKIIQFCVF